MAQKQVPIIDPTGRTDGQVVYWDSGDAIHKYVTVATEDDYVAYLTGLTGLVHRYDFAQASGNFTDSVGSLTLAVTGTPSYQQSGPLGATSAAEFTTGVFGQAASMGSWPTGSNDRTIVLIYRTSADISTASKATWFYGTSGSTRQLAAFKLNESASYQDSFVVWADDHSIANRGTSDGHWHMSACGVSGGGDSGFLFIDGGKWARRFAGSLNTTTTTNPKIPGDTGYTLQVDDLAVFSTWLGWDELDHLWRLLRGLL